MTHWEWKHHPKVQQWKITTIYQELHLNQIASVNCFLIVQMLVCVIKMIRMGTVFVGIYGYEMKLYLSIKPFSYDKKPSYNPVCNINAFIVGVRLEPIVHQNIHTLQMELDVVAEMNLQLINGA